MSTYQELIQQIEGSLRESYVETVRYVYTKDESQHALYDDTMNDLYTQIEIDFSTLESIILPTLPTNDERKRVELALYRFKERYRDLRTMNRSQKVNGKMKYLESLYLKSFDTSELASEKSETEINNIEKEEANKELYSSQYNSIDDSQLQELSAQEKLLQQNTLLTDKLQNVNALMKSTLLAGEINLSELEISTNSLSNLSDSYAFFSSVLNKTNTLVKTINKASKNERAMIYRSLYFFIAVCCWILWRRIFKRPILLLIWLILSPVKLFIWSSSGSSPLSSSPPSFSSSFSSSIETTSNIIAATLSTVSTVPINTSTFSDVISTATEIMTTIIEETIEKDEL